MLYFSVEGQSIHDVLSPCVAGRADCGTNRPHLLDMLHRGSYLRRRYGFGGQVLLVVMVLGAPTLSSVRQSVYVLALWCTMVILSMRSQARVSKLGTWLMEAAVSRHTWVHGIKQKCGSF